MRLKRQLDRCLNLGTRMISVQPSYRQKLFDAVGLTVVVLEVR